MHTPRFLPILGFSILFGALPLHADKPEGLLSWRGPLQTGVIPGQGFPEKWTPQGENHLWTYDIKGGGTPVIANGKLYAFGYYDNPTDLKDVVEALICLDAASGELLWEHRFRDYISDVVYNRYGVGSPIVDPETGNVYLQASNGRTMAFSADGELLWEHSLIENLARLTFPNGRTGSLGLDEDLVIAHCVTANWGGTGPARDRLYAFDKITGELVWWSTAGTVPDDSSFGMPVFVDLDGHRLCYVGLGCGNVACVDARTGKPQWRFQLAKGGVNSQIIPYGDDKVIAIHGKENVDKVSKGRLVCLKVPQEYNNGEQIVLGEDAEVWRNDEHVAFTSSPVLVGDRIYSTIATGSLLCVDAKTGKTLWSKKLGPDQLHASPAYGDGKLYIPIADGKFYILKPGEGDAEILTEVELHVPCLGTPALWAGKCYLMTKGGLHCFGDKDGEFEGPSTWESESTASGEVASLQIVPGEFALVPGGSQKFTIWGLDSKGRRLKKMEGATWEAFVPPTARVKSKVEASFEGDTLTAPADAAISAGAFQATIGDLKATCRGRVVASYGYEEDFEDFALPLKNKDGEAVAFPPLPWLGARIKWHVHEEGDGKVMSNRLDNILFQRTMNFFGDPEMSDYIVKLDGKTDGTRRIRSTWGVVNQRYLFTLDGNAQKLEISSNHERVKESTKFKITPKTWYTLITQVDRKPDGSGTLRAKAWPREEAEPSAWTLEVELDEVHEKGAPGIFAFSPQSQKRVTIDNLSVSKAK